MMALVMLVMMTMMVMVCQILNDTCPNINDTGVDSDNDGQDNACDIDDDNDNILDGDDNCPTVANADQLNIMTIISVMFVTHYLLLTQMAMVYLTGRNSHVDLTPIVNNNQSDSDYDGVGDLDDCQGRYAVPVLALANHNAPDPSKVGVAVQHLADVEAYQAANFEIYLDFDPALSYSVGDFDAGPASANRTVLAALESGRASYYSDQYPTESTTCRRFDLCLL